MRGNTTGLTFSHYKLSQLTVSFFYLKKDFDLSRAITRSWLLDQNSYYTGDYVHIARGTLRTSEKGMYVIFNSDIANNCLEILDTNLVSKKLINIPAFGPQNWLSKSLADTNAVYFADSYYNSSVQLNSNSSANVIPIQNNGQCNIFIGKYNVQGAPRISIAPAPDKYRLCSDSVALHLSVVNKGSVPLTYRWAPGSIVSDSTILIKVFTTADSITATLTITDTAGGHFTENFTFFKGIVSDLKLVPSDTIACRGDTITLTLSGSQFGQSFILGIPSQTFIPGQTSLFNSITDIQKYVMSGSHTATLYNYDDPSLPPSQYCIASTVQITRAHL